MLPHCCGVVYSKVLCPSTDLITCFPNAVSHYQDQKLFEGSLHT